MRYCLYGDHLLKCVSATITMFRDFISRYSRSFELVGTPYRNNGRWCRAPNFLDRVNLINESESE